ncbi:hypothetical protein BOX15_Mlig002959g1 [Macrostomum lignano]|uniref:UPAR/Ly6 domain-containing protein n=1 Tax=Macrostomum lignano TaxID=282301 RepID=A0A267FXU0_9PLAT|nr:hypothetical protein BOX15_Mlig002959g1 [Macrostomum lignano]
MSNFPAVLLVCLVMLARQAGALNCYTYNAMSFNGNGTSQDCGAMTHCVKYVELNNGQSTYVKECADNSNKCTDVQSMTTGTIESCSVCSAELCNFDVVVSTQTSTVPATPSQTTTIPATPSSDADRIQKNQAAPATAAAAAAAAVAAAVARLLIRF